MVCLAGGCFWLRYGDWRGDAFVKKITKNAKLHQKYVPLSIKSRVERTPYDCRLPPPHRAAAWERGLCRRGKARRDGRKPCDHREPSPSSRSRLGARVVSQREGAAGWAKALRSPRTIPLIAQPIGSAGCVAEGRRGGMGESPAITESHPPHRAAAWKRGSFRRGKLRMQHAQ